MESGVINDYEPLNSDFLDKDIMVIEPKTNDTKMNGELCIVSL